ncbi:MAG: MBL fold metallo-hydrolase [Pseudomonadota bacterium]
MAAFRFASLGSGSRGNAMLVAAGDTRLLVDNGFGLRETVRRLARLETAPESLSAVLVTHEHSDHASGVAALAARYRLPVYLTAGTKRAIEARGHFDGLDVDCRRVVRGQAFVCGPLTVTPVRVPHDAAEPCQFVFDCAGARFGMLTDLGSLTPQVVEAYAQCDALFLECNHDAKMLADGPYHASLKARVGGDFGHLGNAQAAQLLGQVDRRRLTTLVLGHLSEKNNRVPLARRAAAEALGCDEDSIVVASQESGHGWLTINESCRVPADSVGGTGSSRGA